MVFERKLPNEDGDIADIVRCILVIQSRFAAAQKRPLGRGTHIKGLCVRGTFEVFDVLKTVADPALAARLARGAFAQPGTYPAVVRFANAASQVGPDSKPDVRALSFAVEFPPGVLPGGVLRHDFSMNNAPTFPLNDPHSFASFLKVSSAGGAFAALKAVAALPFRDITELGRTAARGLRQQRQPLRPYQQTRYWSTVPFLHGADEAVKYSALPAAANIGREIGKGASVLRDELIRHITQDAEMASFDFALQLLDVQAMTHEGTTRDATFWVENASVEWPESQAPFHTVARLTLLRNSLLSDAECDAQFIDVTKFSIPESRPIGGINRARWAAESASRKARLGPPPGVAAPAAIPAAAADERRALPAPIRFVRGIRRRLGDITIRTVFRTTLALVLLAALLVAGLSLATILYTANHGGMLPPEPAHQVVYADQGWGPGLESRDRQTYYYTAQGAALKDLRYSWFVHLEMPWGRERFADPAVLERYGFVVDPPTDRNPDRLPVGFSRHFDAGLQEELLDITCAACHTGQLNVTRGGRTTAVRIDGGSALHAFTDANFGHFVPTLVSSMMSTLTNPLKFNRFARKVLGDRYPGGKGALRIEMVKVLNNFLAMGFREKWYGLVPTEEGYGRTDALTRISNTVFADHLDAVNYEIGNAPVNYPPVWNIWKFDWVQYNASVSQPMARNIGETMGTGAKYALVNRYGGPLPPQERFRSSALVENLHTIELTLRKLRPPAWPEDILGPIDREKARRGKELFDKHCVTCHGPFVAPEGIKRRNAPLKTETDPEWLVRTVCVQDVGTDPNTAENFVRATVDLSKTGLTAADLRETARKTLLIFKDRQSAFLTSEIARLKSQPPSTETSAELSAREAELARLDSDMQQTLSGIDPQRVPVGAALSYIGTMIREKAYADLKYPPEQQPERDGFGTLDMPQVVNAYKPRPLAGMWASPPYLHNGSVPTIYDLLSPVAERPGTFRVGSREFDPVKVGLAAQASGFWVFDTSADGNRNTGHEFSDQYEKQGRKPRNGVIGPFLAPDDRLAIIEHLKIRDDDVDGPKEPAVPPWSDCPAPQGRGTSRRY